MEGPLHRKNYRWWDDFCCSADGIRITSDKWEKLYLNYDYQKRRHYYSNLGRRLWILVQPHAQDRAGTNSSRQNNKAEKT